MCIPQSMIIENAHATPPHLDVFLRSGCYGEMQGSLRSLHLGVWAGCCLVGFWLLQGAFLSPAVDFGALGLHFESFGSLWGEPEAPGARRGEKLRKFEK